MDVEADKGIYDVPKGDNMSGNETTSGQLMGGKEPKEGIQYSSAVKQEMQKGGKQKSDVKQSPPANYGGPETRDSQGAQP